MKLVGSTDSKRACCLAAVIVGVLLKFWLIAETEIVDDYHDPSEYVLQILYPENGGLGYGHGTGYIGRIFYDIGLRYRVGIEIAYMAALALVLKALFDWPGRQYAATGLFLFAIFDPAIMNLFAQMYSDQVWMVETMGGFALLVLAMKMSGWRRTLILLLAAVALGLSSITRSVVVPLFVTLTFFGALVLAILLFNNRRHELGNQLAVFLLSMWSVLLGIGIVYQGTCVCDARIYGFNGISVPDSNEYKTLYLCLQSVGDPDGDTYFPIGKDRRKLIAQAGPHAKWLMDQLDQDTLDTGGTAVQYHKSDIPAGQFHWAVFHVTVPACQYDLRKTYAFFRTVEDEIADASRRGVLKTRWSIPLPDNRLRLVAAAIPHELSLCAGFVNYEPPDTAQFSNQEPSWFVDPKFTMALHRRVVEISPLRNDIWNALLKIYSLIYQPWLFFLFLTTLIAMSGVSIWRWKIVSNSSLKFLAQQIFVIHFFCLMGWYTLFGASGVGQDPRYMIFNHVLLPILVTYYLFQIARLLRNESSVR